GAIGPSAAIAEPALRQLRLKEPGLAQYVECAIRLIARNFTYDSSMAWQSALPQFPWPKPSAAGQLALSAFPATSTRLKDVSDVLERALTRLGYSDRRYFAVGQDGFALVTRLERIDDTGEALPSPNRWAMGAISPGFDVLEIAKRLVVGDTRSWRLTTLVVSKQVTEQNTVATQSEAASWISGQGLWLPSEVGFRPLRGDSAKDEYHCSVLVYHFVKEEGVAPRLLIPDDKLTIADHLAKIRLEAELRRIADER